MQSSAAVSSRIEFDPESPSATTSWRVTQPKQASLNALEALVNVKQCRSTLTSTFSSKEQYEPAAVRLIQSRLIMYVEPVIEVDVN